MNRELKLLARVYFNRHEDSPKVWSVDFGPGTEEILTESVIINLCGCYTSYDGSNDNTVTPKAWLYVSSPRVTVLPRCIVLE